MADSNTPGGTGECSGKLSNEHACHCAQVYCHAEKYMVIETRTMYILWLSNGQARELWQATMVHGQKEDGYNFLKIFSCTKPGYCIVIIQASVIQRLHSIYEATVKLTKTHLSTSVKRAPM